MDTGTPDGPPKRSRGLRRVARQALVIFGIEPTSLSLLGNAYNTTFLVAEHGGARSVLHILRPLDAALPETQRRARIHSELWWLDRLHDDLGLDVPQVMRTPAGESVVLVTNHDGLPLVCTLFRWIDGRFKYTRLTPGDLEQVGRLTARLHRSSETVNVPDWFDRPVVQRPNVDGDDPPGELFYTRHSPEAGRLISDALACIRQTHIRLGHGPDAFGLIHADIHQHNYMFADGTVRLIDFGDCGFGHYLYDVATTIQQLWELPHVARLRAAYLAGYRAERPLSAEHEAMLPAFMMLREIQDITGYLYTPDEPHHARWSPNLTRGLARISEWLQQAQSHSR